MKSPVGVEKVTSIGGMRFSRSMLEVLRWFAGLHIVAGEFHYIGKEASTRWTGGPDFSMMADAGILDATDETCREYERVVHEKYLDEIRAQAKQFFTKLLHRKSGLAECAIRNFKKGKNTIRARSLRKLVRAIHDLQNRR